MTGIQNDYRRLPDNEKTAAASLEAVTADPANLRHVPVRNLTYEVITAALEADPESLKILSERGHKELLPMIFSENPELLGRMPQDVLTHEDYIAVVRECGYNLAHVPVGMRTRTMCREAFAASPDLGYDHCDIISLIPYPDVCMECIKEGMDRRDVMELASLLRPETIDRDMAEFLVSHDGRCLAYVPVHLQDEALVMKAVSVSGNSVLAYRTVLDELKTEKAYIAGLSAGFQSFLLVPKDRRTPDICLAAEKMYPDLFRIRPDALPENVRNGRNIFTFSRILEKATGNKYNYEAIKNAYEGRPLAVSRFLAPEGVMKDCTVRYDKENGRFQYKNGIRELRKPNNRTPKLK